MAHAHHVTTHSGRFAALDAELGEMRREDARESIVFAEGVPAIALHQPGLVGAQRVRLHQLAERVHALLVHLRRDTEDLLGDDFERSARAGELFDDGIDQRHWPRSSWTRSNDQSSLPLPTGP
jgi:hypothetical protein